MSNSPNEVMENGPTQDHFDVAFDRAMEDPQMLQFFFDSVDPPLFIPFQLYHKYGGLPKMDKSEADDAERDEWSSYMENLLDAFRGWLEKNKILLDMANAVMTEEIANNQTEAAEYAAECARDHIEANHLNGGW
jgi:hypothetical protein